MRKRKTQRRIIVRSQESEGSDSGGALYVAHIKLSYLSRPCFAPPCGCDELLLLLWNELDGLILPGETIGALERPRPPANDPIEPWVDGGGGGTIGAVEKPLLPEKDPIEP